MGNICCFGRNKNSASSRRTPAFSGQGNRLGTTNDNAYANERASSDDRKIYDPASSDQLIIDENLNEEERTDIRRERAAAAEARLKKMGGATKKKIKTSNSEPLRGPNSQPTMQWNL
mmetsp:Transcript_61405/g.73861  ORF Transcript_61405/g.73861 Transcript_61405/m.73861 type:complete len:117 (+) Transcript_61405:108-458(+)